MSDVIASPNLFLYPITQRFYDKDRSFNLNVEEDLDKSDSDDIMKATDDNSCNGDIEPVFEKKDDIYDDVLEDSLEANNEGLVVSVSR